MTTPARPAFVYLASQSPRRRELLERAGIACVPLLPGEDEDAEALEAMRPREAALAYVERVTQAKLAAAARRLAARGLRPAPIVCADTTVAIGSRILGKPEGAADAARMLGLLAGKTHRVLTAVAVRHGRRTAALTRTTRVRFAPLGAEEIAAYVASGEPFGKAGAYAIQGRAAAFVESVAGSYTAVIGLPLRETVVLLRGVGVYSIDAGGAASG